VIREFDLNRFASTDLNQLYASDFDFKITIVWFVILVGNWTISIYQHWSDVDVWCKRTLWCVILLCGWYHHSQITCRQCRSWHWCRVRHLVIVMNALEVVENRCSATSMEQGYEANRLNEHIRGRHLSIYNYHCRCQVLRTSI